MWVNRKGSRGSTFKAIDLDEMKRFFCIYLLWGVVKFSVIRGIFSQNPLYNHPIINYIMSDRRSLLFDQLPTQILWFTLN